MTDSTNAKQVSFFYKNYRGELSVRTVTPIRIFWGSTKYHPESQWIMVAFDHDKSADRDFALRDCDFRYYSEFSASLSQTGSPFIKRNSFLTFPCQKGAEYACPNCSNTLRLREKDPPEAPVIYVCPSCESVMKEKRI